MRFIDNLKELLERNGAYDFYNGCSNDRISFHYKKVVFRMSIDTYTRKGMVWNTYLISYDDYVDFDDKSKEHENQIKQAITEILNEMSEMPSDIAFHNAYGGEGIEGCVRFNYTDMYDLAFRAVNALNELLIAAKTFGKMMENDGSRTIMEIQDEALFEHIRENLSINILYVHGFRSSGSSGTSERLRRFLPHCRVVSPDLPVDAEEAVAMLKRLVTDEKIDVVVGTSMGGMFAQKLRGVPKILVNPSFFVSETFRRNMGTVTYFNPRNDGAMEFEITPEIVAGYKAVERDQFRSLSEREKKITIGAFGINDETVDCRSTFLTHYGIEDFDNTLFFDGGHRLDEDTLKYCIIPAIARLYRFRDQNTE